MNEKIIRIHELVEQGESESLEFKKNFDREAIETITAFANTKGGILLVGVEDNGNIAGTTINKETIQNWLNQVKHSTVPSVIPDMETVAVENKDVVLIKVIEYPIKPVAFKGKYIKRVKNSNHQMEINEVIELHLKTFNTSWDYYVDNNHSAADISLEKVRKFIELANKYKDIKITDDPMRVLNKFELLRENKITYGGFLLFMKENSALTTIELGRFQTPTIIKDSVTLKCDILSEVEGVMDFIKKHINKSYIITGSLQREERWDYPLDALREIVVNAVVHRDYRDASDSIIKIFDDRIECYNPGKLPEDLSVKKLLSGDYVSTIRNKKIAEVFKEANIIEKYGSGIGRVLEGFEKHGLPSPKFEEMMGGFRVTAFKSTPKKTPPHKEQKDPPIKPQIPPNKTTGTPRKLSLSQRILNILEENPGLSQKEVAKKLGISFDTSKEYFSKLKKAGKVKRVGSRKNGDWQVING